MVFMDNNLRRMPPNFHVSLDKTYKVSHYLAVVWHW